MMRHTLAGAMLAVGIFTGAAPTALLMSMSANAAPETAIPLASLAHVHGLEFEPDGDALLLATHHGVFRHEPGGPAVQVSPDRSDYMGFTLKSDGTVMASGHPEAGGNSGVLISHDRGTSWQHVTDGVEGPVDFHALADAENDPLVLFGLYQGAIQHSTDGGQTWSITGSAPAQTFDLASSSDGSILFASGPDGVRESKDSGATWKVIPGNIPIATSLVVVFGDQLYAYAITQGLLRRNMSEAVWQVVTTDIGEAVPLHMARSATDVLHLVLVTQESKVLESRDGGATWAPRA